MTINLQASDSHDQGGTLCALRSCVGSTERANRGNYGPRPVFVERVLPSCDNEPLTLDRFLAYVSEPVSRHLPGITSS